MKIHFMAAVDGNKQDYKAIIDEIERLGHTLITKHYLERDIKAILDEPKEESQWYAKKIHEWIKKADVTIFETTESNASVGFEIATALRLLKPVIVMFKKGDGMAPLSLKGFETEKLQIIEYDQKGLSAILGDAIEYAQNTNDTRFNFFISPRHSNYLDWIAQNDKLPRAVYLRNLIEKDMEDNEEYK